MYESQRAPLTRGRERGPNLKTRDQSNRAPTNHRMHEDDFPACIRPLCSFSLVSSRIRSRQLHEATASQPARTVLAGSIESRVRRWGAEAKPKPSHDSGAALEHARVAPAVARVGRGGRLAAALVLSLTFGRSRTVGTSSGEAALLESARAGQRHGGGVLAARGHGSATAAYSRARRAERTIPRGGRPRCSAAAARPGLSWRDSLLSVAKSPHGGTERRPAAGTAAARAAPPSASMRSARDAERHLGNAGGRGSLATGQGRRGVASPWPAHVQCSPGGGNVPGFPRRWGMARLCNAYTPPTSASQAKTLLKKSAGKFVRRARLPWWAASVPPYRRS